MVLGGLPRYVKHIIVVDDASPDKTSDVVGALARKDRRITLLPHESNQGVGGAMRTGFQKALELGAQIVVKVDGDNQMDLTYLPDMLMPLIRRIGNLGLGFLTKAATGYWNIFDPTNGYVAIRASVLAQLPLQKIDRTFFFETSMLANLYMVGAVIKDVPMPARYHGEISNLSVRRTLIEFPFKLMKTLLRRIVVKYMIYDFSMASIYLITSIPLLLFGLIFGIVKWVDYASRNIPAPTGTVMLPTLSVLLGIQFLVAAIEIDLRSTPKEPLSPPL